MHLSRLTLDPRSAQARRDLANPYDMHRTLVRAFVQDEAQKPPRFLWRLEPNSTWSAPVVLVQSAQAAKWQALEAMPGYLKGGKVESKPVQLEHLLQAQARYRFRLFANPTVTRQEEGKRKRYGLTSESTQVDWLHRQGARLGFKVENVLVTGSDMLKGLKESGVGVVQLQRACFEGVLRAMDVEALGSAMQNGIGHGKAFGCGLLSVVRIS